MRTGYGVAKGGRGSPFTEPARPHSQGRLLRLRETASAEFGGFCGLRDGVKGRIVKAAKTLPLRGKRQVERLPSPPLRRGGTESERARLLDGEGDKARSRKLFV